MPKLSPRQIAMLTALVRDNGRVMIVHSPGSQDLRTARSLTRHFNVVVRRLTKMEGQRFSYGYRAIRITCGPSTLAEIGREIGVPDVKVGDTVRERVSGKKWTVASVGGVLTLVSQASGVQIAYMADDFAADFVGGDEYERGQDMQTGFLKG